MHMYHFRISDNSFHFIDENRSIHKHMLLQYNTLSLINSLRFSIKSCHLTIEQ